MVDEYGSRQLVASIVEQAVHDRRLAVTLDLIDSAAPLRRPEETSAVKKEIAMYLHSFFFRGGLEVALEAAKIDIPVSSIRRKSIEPYEGRKRRTEG